MTSLITEQRDRMNLATVKRFDPYIQKILFTSQESCLYEYCEDAWTKLNTEGVFFLYQRRADPRFGFIILNRHNSNNLLEPVTSEFDFKFEGNFLLYKNKESKVHGIWFVEEDSCRIVYDLTQKLIEEQENDKKSESEAAAAFADSAVAPGEEEVKGIGGLANLLSKAALKNSGGGTASTPSKAASNGGNRNQGTVKNPPSASKLMDLLSSAEDKDKEKKQKVGNHHSQKSQQHQKQKAGGQLGNNNKKEERREVVEEIIVPQKAYLLGKEKKMDHKSGGGADKLGNVAAFFAKASEGGPTTSSQQQQPPVPMMPTGGIMPPNNASAPMAMPTPLMATGISMMASGMSSLMTSGMSSMIPLEAAAGESSERAAGSEKGGHSNNNPNALQRLMSNPGVNSLENLERLQRMKSVSPTLASQAVNLSELEEALTAPAASFSATRPQQGATMSYASAAAAPPPSHPLPDVKSNLPLQAVKDSDLTTGLAATPGKGGGERGNSSSSNKQQKKLISPAALERTTPNTAKHQGENTPLVQAMFPPASSLPLPPMPLTAPRESQVLEEQQQQQLKNGQQPPHQPLQMQQLQQQQQMLQQEQMLQQRQKMLALQQQQQLQRQLSYPQQQLVLNREQFVDTYHFLLNNDADFVDKLHLAYLTRVQTMQQPQPPPIVLPQPPQNL